MSLDTSKLMCHKNANYASAQTLYLINPGMWNSYFQFR